MSVAPFTGKFKILFNQTIRSRFRLSKIQNFWFALSLKREMHLKSSAGRPKGKCKSTVSLSLNPFTKKKDNMAAEVNLSGHVETSVASGYTFCASPLYESKPRL